MAKLDTTEFIPIFLRIDKGNIWLTDLVIDIEGLNMRAEGNSLVGELKITRRSEQDENLYRALVGMRYPEALRLLADIMESET